MPSIFKKSPFKRHEEAVVESDKYIDLGDLVFEEEAVTGANTTYVKVAELYRYEDLSALTNLVYNGSILILDYNGISNDQLALKRVINELKSVARDTNGDVAGIAKNTLIVTPSGTKVDRKKIKGLY